MGQGGAVRLLGRSPWRQSLTVRRGMPVARSISQLFRPLAMRLATRSRSAEERTFEDIRPGSDDTRGGIRTRNPFRAIAFEAILYSSSSPRAGAGKGTSTRRRHRVGRRLVAALD